MATITRESEYYSSQYDKNNSIKNQSIPQFSQPYDDNKLIASISPIYTDILDIYLLLTAVWGSVKDLQKDINQSNLNNFIQTCDEGRLKEFEEICGFKDTESGTLSSRRIDIIQKFAIHLPYNYVNLQELLNQLLGYDNWNIVRDFENYSLTINVKVVNDERIEVLIKTLKNFIPCHLDYIINHSIKLDTEGTEFFVGYTQLITSDELSMSAVYA